MTFSISSTGSLQMVLDLVNGIGRVNLAVFFILLPLFAFIIGKMASSSILVKRKSRFLVSYASGFLIVISSTLVSSLFSIAFQSPAAISLSNAAFFISRSVVWMLGLSFIPVIIAGSWFGNRIIEGESRLY